jgi:hypothetical protein
MNNWTCQDCSESNPINYVICEHCLINRPGYSRFYSISSETLDLTAPEIEEARIIIDQNITEKKINDCDKLIKEINCRLYF